MPGSEVRGRTSEPRTHTSPTVHITTITITQVPSWVLSKAALLFILQPTLLIKGVTQ